MSDTVKVRSIRKRPWLTQVRDEDGFPQPFEIKPGDEVTISRRDADRYKRAGWVEVVTAAKKAAASTAS